MHRHFTATVFIIDSKQRTLLLWHKRLGRWMPPGGHIDEDETPEDAAKRECREETGLDVEILGAHDPSPNNGAMEQWNNPFPDLFVRNSSEGRMLKKPIALLLENIPESVERNEPAHQHMDFLYIARPLDESQMIALAEEEGREIRWFTKGEIEALDEKSEIFANVKTYILSLLS